jgi:2'-5' RNA ligase
MPYEIKQSSDGYCVHKQGGGLVPGGCHKSKSGATRHMRALYANEPEATKAIDFTPPDEVRSTAAAGLAKRREYKRGGTAVGIARARDLSGGKQISPSTIRRMVSFFARHEVDKRAKGFSAGEDGYPSNGRIAWELWGGDAGRAWANKIARQMEAESTKEHTGVMVALPVPERYRPLIAALQSQVPFGAEMVPAEELHVTLLYLGDSSDVEHLKTRIYAGSLKAIEWQDGIPARLTGLARFNGNEGGKNPLVLLVDSPLLPELRQKVFSHLVHERGIPDNQRHGFIPHITLGYIPAEMATPQIVVPPAKIVFDSFVVAWGDDQLVVPLSGEAAYKADGKGYGARAGEVIAGNLTRGADGRFGSAGSSQPAASAAEGEGTSTTRPRRQRLGKTAAANEERKRQERENKKRTAAEEREKKRQARRAEVEGRRRSREVKREADKKRKAEEKQRQLEENRKKVIERTPLKPEAYESLLAFAEAREGEFDPRMIEALAKETGLITIGSDGTFRLNPETRAFLKAVDKGDTRGALDAISRAGDRLERDMGREEKRQAGEESEKSLSVFKGKDGRYRWILLSSNAYRDRDGEIVSTKALAQDVARADRDKDFGPLRWWHVPGVDIGDCDFNALSGRVLVESGTFRNEAIGEAVFKAQDNLQASIGFRHPFTEPDAEGVFHNIRRFERSLVPAGRAANRFTRLVVKQGGKMDQQKMEALKALIGEEGIQAILSQVQATQKEADGAGIAYKEAEETPANVNTTLTVGSIADYITSGASSYSINSNGTLGVTSLKETPDGESDEGDDSEEEEAVKEGEYAGDMDPAALTSMIASAVTQSILPLVQALDVTTKMADFEQRMGGMMEEMKGFMGSRNKDDEIALLQEQQARKDQENAQAKAALEAKMAALESQLGETKKALAELTGEQPRAMQQGGYRASQAADTVIQKPEEHRLKESEPSGFDPNFFAFVTRQDTQPVPPA